MALILFGHIYNFFATIFNWFMPKKTVFLLDGPESVVTLTEKPCERPLDSRSEYPIGYTGPRVLTEHR